MDANATLSQTEAIELLKSILAESGQKVYDDTAHRMIYQNMPALPNGCYWREAIVALADRCKFRHV